MQKITFVIPSRNNLEFLKLAYNSIRKLGIEIHHGVAITQIVHDILILDDASEDGTWEWVQSLNDDNVITYRNTGTSRLGVVGMFDKGIEMSRTDIIFAFHADMVAAPRLDNNILKHLKPGYVICATRVEPPLHPSGPEKITMNFGIEADEFNEDKFNDWAIHQSFKSLCDKTTEGIFAPWCMYKSDYMVLGGHDELFAPQSKEDSDLFNRFQLAGYKLIQSWDGLVYHFTSRGSRFNKYAGGAAGQNSNEWLHTTNKNARNFIRKWGHFVQHDAMMKPIIPPKYDVGFIIENCNLQLLEALEPWCDKIYIEDDQQVLTDSYIEKEQPNTKYKLSERIFNLKNSVPYKTNNIIVKINRLTLTQEDFQNIQQLPQIIKESGEIGDFQLGNLYITIKDLTTYENELIKCK